MRQQETARGRTIVIPLIINTKSVFSDGMVSLIVDEFLVLVFCAKSLRPRSQFFIMM